MFVLKNIKSVNVRSIVVVVGVLATLIAKAHTNFTSILIEAQSQKEYVKHVKALPRHAVDDHSQCDYHPLVF